MANHPNGADKVVTADGNHSPNNLTKYPNLGYKFACTERFAELSPFLKYRGEYKDKNVLLYSGSSVDSMSLHAPILQDIKHKKDFYMVDMHAILPHTWDFIHNQPSHGDDIDASLANCLIYLIYPGEANGSIFSGFRRLIAGGTYPSGYLWTGTGTAGFTGTYRKTYFIDWLRSFAYLNEFFAPDSLFAKFRIPLADILDPNGGRLFFDILDQAWDLYHKFLGSFQAMAAPATSVLGDDIRNIQIWFRDSANNILLRKIYNWESVEGRMAFYYDFLDNSNIEIANFTGVTFADNSTVFESMYDAYIVNNGVGFEKLLNVWNASDSVLKTYFTIPNGEKPINIENIIAYQLACAEYFTNDLIDYVYSADIFRRLFESFAFTNQLTYTYNDYTQPYDGFSCITLATLFNDVHNLSSYDLLMSLITHKRSLRYVDYFVGGRSTPLLAADTAVTVNSNVASAIDITQKTLAARFNLFVQRVGRKAENYLQKIFHTKPRVDVCCPVNIGNISELIYKEETQNTAADQLTLDNSRTATLKAHNKQFAFDTDCDVASIIIGISSYEITRFYDCGLDPFARKVDRYDMFNPMLQSDEHE